MGFLKFIQNITKSTQGAAFDPAVFEHPLALKTSWAPQAGGGANFKTRSLKEISSSELRFVASGGSKIFAGIIIAFPILFMVIGVWSIISQGYQFEMLLFMLIPLSFMVVGLFLIKKTQTAIVFDKSAGLFYKGSKKNFSSLNAVDDKNVFKLNDIRALQVISERIRSKNSSYTSYEINIIFEDGNRYNIIDHGNRTSIETDAVRLSDFLGVPVWNKVSSTSYLSKNKSTPTDYDSVNRYDTPQRYEEPTYIDTSTDDLDEPYDSMKRREL